MDLLHSGRNDKLLEIDCIDEFSLTFSGESINKKARDLSININTTATLTVALEYKDKNKIIVKVITDNGELAEVSGPNVKPCFYENGKYQLILEVKDKGRYEVIHMGSNLNNGFQKISNCYIGMIDFSSDIGLSNFIITKYGKDILSIDIEVFPSKIDYQKDYRDIMNEVNDEIYSLAFALMGKTYLETRLVDTNHQTNAEFISILRCIFDDLEKAIKRIIANPKHNVVTIESIRRIEKSRVPSRNTIAYLRKNSSCLSENKNGFIKGKDKNYTAAMVVDKRKITTTDIYENRFVKYMISNIIKRLNAVVKNIVINMLSNKANNNSNNIDEKVLLHKFLKSKISILEKHLKNGFSNVSNLTGKKTMSLVFQMAPGYREVYKKYIMLSKGLALGDGLYQMTPKKLYLLYEMWCYMKIHHILSDLGYQVEEYGILKYKDNGFYLTLSQDSEAKMIYSNKKNRLELWYNKSYSSPTTNQRPDTVLNIRNLNNENDNRIYIFDAKYRINVDDKGNIGPVEDDINVMHRYRDAIVSKLKNEIQFKYDTFGAYVMFPYGDEEKFKEHEFYKSIEEVNIGAFPMLPGSTKLITNQLKKIIEQSSLDARNDRVVIDEYDDYGKFKHLNVMIANVKDENHFKVYKEKLFYHIPVASLKEVRESVEYIAFYQSNLKIEDEGGVRYYGKIKECLKYKRKDCIEIKARAGTENDEYIRINLEYIKVVDNIVPIQTGTRLVTYTTLYLLKNAENTHELKVESSLELVVYKVLKKVAKEKCIKIKKIDKEKDSKNNKMDKGKEYIIGDVRVEIVDEMVIKMNGISTNVNELEKNILRTMVNL
ncbi:DUF2357 domain-containing protein [Clostridium lacusfryxellense]|uniref:DUF2357 domain-containing protein n=1 Tax=Clostridium lacusfryxellense TaxID=205328 RepID=UPI001C0B4CA9|nr:DUF2357 domain-containing protein [Clostridium lacusfryxellense]MBU3110178.1 restriction endonuclease-like protein [Clostridium lacusfryxellense]